MAILNKDDIKRLANWYRGEITFLRWIGNAISANDKLLALKLIDQRRDIVADQINKLAEATGVEPIRRS